MSIRNQVATTAERVSEPSTRNSSRTLLERRNSSALRGRSHFRAGAVGGLDENVDDLLLAAARRAQVIAQLSAGFSPPL